MFAPMNLSTFASVLQRGCKAVIINRILTYYKKYKIYYVVDSKTMTVYIVRILHMLEDSRAQLYKIFE